MLPHIVGNPLSALFVKRLYGSASMPWCAVRPSANAVLRAGTCRPSELTASLVSVSFGELVALHRFGRVNVPYCGLDMRSRDRRRHSSRVLSISPTKNRYRHSIAIVGTAICLRSADMVLHRRSRGLTSAAQRHRRCFLDPGALRGSGSLRIGRR